jgi:TIR domain-containing protein
VATLFFSYAHADEDLRDQLETHLSGLRRQGIISSWHDRRIIAGTDIGHAIDSHIDTADIVLLLVSPNFIASDYCYEREMERALERQHRKSTARVRRASSRSSSGHQHPQPTAGHRIGHEKVPLLHQLADLISLRTPRAFGRKPNALPTLCN